MEHQTGKMRARRLVLWPLVLGICAGGTSWNEAHHRAFAGVTSDSPEVKKLIEGGLAYLNAQTESRLGGKCLVGLAFIKAGRGDHARVGEAVQACYAAMKANVSDADLDVYSNGLAVVFLCEAGARQYARQIEWYLDRLKKRQMTNGGWGYIGFATGDTSQSQCVALGLWEASRHGFNLDQESVDKFADWLLRTQGPSGEWGYQGIVTTTDAPMAQENVSCAMVSAGLGSTYICAELFGLRGKTKPTANGSETLPAALRAVSAAGGAKVYRPHLANVAKIQTAITRGHDWMSKNYKIDLDSKTYYYLYSLERYNSFREEFENVTEESPKWYNDGVKYLMDNKGVDGGWSGFCGNACDTAFATLFLLRSTKKSIQAKLSEGMLLAGRGLPSNLSRAKLRNGELIVEQVHTKVDQLLSMIDDGDDAVLDDLARDPSQLVVDQVDDKSARRLQQLVRGGEPEVRILAVRSLGRTGNLDYVPTLLFALTDPDRRVVVEARDELKFISRNFEGFGPPDEFNEQQRYEAVDAWKKWYLSIRPSAVLEQP